MAEGDFVFLFDDDSVASPDLIAQHLLPVATGQVHASTGVAVAPPPNTEPLPEAFRHFRLAQTFDTGNSLLPIDLARRVGGLDRNYDFGPGTDADFGTRLYLAGFRILHNPHAVRIHYKAPLGGLRVHGAHKYNTDSGILAPFPPVTQSYYSLRYLSPRQSRERALLAFYASKVPRGVRSLGRGSLRRVLAYARFVVSLGLFPIKRAMSLRGGRALLRGGVRLTTTTVAIGPIPAKSLP
jgi:GT2 family glycosyltransferase